MSTSSSGPRVFQPIIAQYPGDKFVVGGGVAIFHLASSRVVICSAVHRGEKYYFLPKGRRDAGEESGRGAEREGYEEVSINKGTASRLYTNISFTRVATVTASFHYLHSIVSHKHIPVYMHYR
jgi:8-oxo-dGTP pyrophosphatase MutT (NUDIX family)